MLVQQLHPNDAAKQVAVLNDIDYTTMTVADLKSECKAKGFEGYSDMKKAELLELLGTTL